MSMWKELLIHQSYTILDAMKVLDRIGLQIVIVVDADQRLQGIITDGDVRRAILKGVDLSESVSEVMNRNPIVLKHGTDPRTINRKLKEKNLRHVPVLDENNRIIDLKLAEGSLNRKIYDNLVVLMAGGLGTRLRPLTDEIPKPLLKVGDKPILETIIQNFYEYGFRNFAISVNYKKELIKHYFGDGSNFGVSITYIEEDKRLGTAGALSLLTEKQIKSMIIMNGDLLTKVNFEQLLYFHEENNSQATMCVREYEYQVPYGVIKTRNQQLIAIEEKPIERYFVNAGIYVLNPNVLEMIPPNTFFDMPELFEQLIKENEETVVFPVREYWMDIGRLADYEQANTEYRGLF